MQISPPRILRRPPAEESRAGHLDGAARRRLLLLAAAMLTTSVVLWVTVLPRLTHAPHSSGVSWFALAAGFALAEIVVVHLPFRRKAHTFSMSEAPLVLGLLLASPLVLLTAQAVGAGLAMALWRRQSPAKVAFNLVQFSFASTVAWTGVHLLHAAVAPRSLADLGIALAAAVLVGLLQTSAVTVALRLVGERITRSIVLQTTGFSLVSSAANGALALVGLHLVTESSWFVSLFVVIPVGLLLAAYRVAWHEREQARGLEVLYSTARQLQAATTADEIAEGLLAPAREQLRASRVELILWGRGGKTLQASADETGVTAPTFLTGATGQDLLRHKLDLHGAVLHPKGGKSPISAYLEMLGHPDAIAIPLGPVGASIGAVVAAGREGQIDSFTHEDVAILDSLAGTVAIQLERLRLGSTLDEVLTLRNENEELARIDTVTGLVRRDALEAEIDEATGARAVIALRVGGIDDVRDALGADHARSLEAAVASRLRRQVRHGDIVGRVETSTFAVLAPLRDDVEVIDGLIRMMRAAMLAPYEIDGHSVVVSVHIGVSVDARGARSGSDQISEGLAAAREAITRTDDVYVTFHEGLRGAAARRTTLAAALHAASRDGEGIAALYQPIVDVGSGKVVGIEALARWTHPTLGQISPAEFLPIAQRIGVMPELGQALLRRALMDASAWRVDGSLIGLTINLSAEQLRDPATTATMEQLLREHHVDRQRLTIDLDASTITHGLDELRNPIEAMSRMGVNIALDDFSVEADVADVLAQLPVDVIKIPGSLVGAGKDRPIDGVLRALLDLGRDLGVGIVVEGLEQAEQLQSLQALGGAMAQGYLVAPPLEAEAVGTLLDALQLRRPDEVGNVIHLHQGSHMGSAG